MKTAISLSDALFEEADQLAKIQGLSRSELYARAIEEYLDKHRRDAIKQALTDFYSKEDSSLDPVLLKMQVLSLNEDNWE